jgi:hypothetical protein
MEGVTFGSFGPEPLAGVPARETRRTSSPGRIPAQLTDQALARATDQPGIATADEVMEEPERVQPPVVPVITYPDRVNTAAQGTVPDLVVTAERTDGTAAGQSLGGIAPPRASRAELIHPGVEGGAEPVTTDRDGHVTFGPSVGKSSGLTEQERLRRTIAEATLQLNALTIGDTRRRGSNSTEPAARMIDTLRAGASGRILRNGLREIPPQRTVAQVPVPPYPHTSFEKELNVAGIYQMAKDQKYRGPVSGEKSTKHQKKLVNYMFNVESAITQFKHSEKDRLEHLCALAHLDGEAKDLVVDWTAKNKRVCRMEMIFSLLTDQCKLVELDVMDIAAEVDATTAYTVALAIQREVGPSGKVAIQQVMKGLNNAIAMRDALLHGDGKFDLISRCRFLLAAFTPPDGVAGRECLIKMREQAR